MPVDSIVLESVMRQACAAARQWLGATSPNPAVAAAALRADGTLIAIDTHHKAGALHAEAKLLKNLGNRNMLGDVATLCVTLEPCNHTGRTPPCTDAIIAAGIKRVVLGARDPNKQVKGGGVERLKAAGIEVITGICEDECQQLIAAFAYSAETGKPWVTIKRAINLQGTMIPPSGQKTFTSEASLHLAHRMRKKCDALLTGSGTVLADNPLFTVRSLADYPGKRRWLAVLDRRRRVPPHYIRRAAERGLDVVIYDDAETALADLHNKGVRDVLVEAGPSLSQHLLDRDLWTMAVTIRQGDPDQISAAFNPTQPISFAPEKFRWDAFLPTA